MNPAIEIREPTIEELKTRNIILLEETRILQDALLNVVICGIGPMAMEIIKAALLRTNLMYTNVRKE